MANSQIRILIIQANPPGTQLLDSDVELRNLNGMLFAALERDQFAAPILLPAARIADLTITLRRHRPHILHFTGHGDGAGGLLLNAPDDQGGAPLTAANLADLIRVYQAEATTPLHLILLAGCRTADAAALLSAHVPCAIGTTDDVADAAIRDHLTPAFYGALADGRSVPNALADAQAQLRSHGYADAAALVNFYAADGLTPNDLRPTAWLQATGQTTGQTTELSPLHLAYLRHWFGQPWRHVSLVDINSNRNDRADRLDLYVPLPVDFALTVQTKDGKIIDWWVDGEPESNRFFVKDLVSGKVEPTYTRRQWADLGVAEAWLQPAIAAIQQRLEQQGTDNRPIGNGEYTQPPLEAHHAAVLRTHFVLLGEPGSGKSSFLRHLTLCLAGGLRHAAVDPGVPVNADLALLYPDWGAEHLAGYTPLYLEMRDVVRVSFPPPEAAQRVNHQTLWRYLDAHQDLAAYSALLRSLIDGGKLILLLDGLDEIPQADQSGRRKQVIAFVTALREQYPTLRIIITSRPYAYYSEEWRLTGFGHTRLQPLALDRLQSLALALFRAARFAEADGEAERFISALRHHPHMEPTLHANPLFFTLLAALWLEDDNHQLPATQAELYRRAVDLLLDKWTRKRAPDLSVAEKLQIPPAHLRPILERLACTVHEQRQAGEDTTRFRTSRLLDEIEDANLQLNAQDVAEYLERHAGLFISPQRGHFYFSHRSFQEHLAACELTCRDPKRTPAVAADRRFPAGLIRRVLEQPQLWRNVAFLASDELMRQGEAAELWALLDDLCRPYMAEDTHTAAVPVALTIAQRHNLFMLDRFDRRHRPIKYAYDELLNVAQRVLIDDTHFTPAERNIAGELLGRRPEHDTRKGVGCRPDGLPAIDWVPIPETDEQGHREFIYQENEHRTEPTFWMARYPVTYGQFQTFIEAADGFTNPLWWERLAAPAGDKAKPGDQEFEFWNHPRERVSWFDAIAFCRWLTAKAKAQPTLLPPALQGRTDWRITLPTEWQWEKAARGFDGLRYPWGEEYVSGDANINETRRKDGPHYLQKTSAVGMYPPNCSPFGIMDLSGNVWEWCLNEYDNPEKIQEGGDAARVVRGGSWRSDSYFASALSRNDWDPLFRNASGGFRVVVGLFSVPVL